MRLVVFLFVMSLVVVAGVRGQEQADNSDSLGALVELLKDSDDTQFQIDILKGMSDALKGRAGVKMPPGWSETAAKLGKSPSAEVKNLAASLSNLFGDTASIEAQKKIILDKSAAKDARQKALRSLLDAKTPGIAPMLQQLLADSAMRADALRGLAAYEDPRTPAAVIGIYKSLSPSEKLDALGTLAAREDYARALFGLLKDKSIPRTDLTAPIVRQLAAYKNDEFDAWIKTNWGSITLSSDEKLKEIARYKELVLKTGPEKLNASNGRATFVKICATCHMLYGEGGKVGPDLTGSGRQDLDYILTNAIDPNAVIGKDYQVTILTTKEKRQYVGIITREDDNTITIIDQVETNIVPRPDVLRMKQSDLSMMPEGLLQGLSEQEALDLIAYLRTSNQVQMPGEKPAAQNGAASQ